MNDLKMIDKKERDLLLTTGLVSGELACHCNSERCNYTIFSTKLLDAYQATRVEFDDYIRVNSAFRCQTHNEIVGGANNSYHTKGMALDLAPRNPNDLPRLIEIARKHFHIIEYKTFVHCDVRHKL